MPLPHEPIITFHVLPASKLVQLKNYSAIFFLFFLNENCTCVSVLTIIIESSSSTYVSPPLWLLIRRSCLAITIVHNNHHNLVVHSSFIIQSPSQISFIIDQNDVIKFENKWPADDFRFTTHSRKNVCLYLLPIPSARFCSAYSTRSGIFLTKLWTHHHYFISSSIIIIINHQS